MRTQRHKEIKSRVCSGSRETREYSVVKNKDLSDKMKTLCVLACLLATTTIPLQASSSGSSSHARRFLEDAAFSDLLCKQSGFWLFVNCIWS
ncbi:UNVERIFIED_CONTAM: hypothetical protein K2H54_032613 [Gekko kuhli]